MSTDTWLAISAGATFLLALAAFWAIWQNYLIRRKDRELSVKIQALDEINEWANNLLQAVMSLGARDERSKLELQRMIRYALSVETSILKLTQIFSGELEEKVNNANKSVSKIWKILFKIPDVEGEGFFSFQDKKHKALVKKSVNSLNDLLEVICKTKLNIFLKDKATKNNK